MDASTSADALKIDYPLRWCDRCQAMTPAVGWELFVSRFNEWVWFHRFCGYVVHIEGAQDA